MILIPFHFPRYLILASRVLIIETEVSRRLVDFYCSRDYRKRGGGRSPRRLPSIVMIVRLMWTIPSRSTSNILSLSTPLNSKSRMLSRTMVQTSFSLPRLTHLISRIGHPYPRWTLMPIWFRSRTATPQWMRSLRLLLPPILNIQPASSQVLSRKKALPLQSLRASQHLKGLVQTRNLPLDRPEGQAYSSALSVRRDPLSVTGICTSKPETSL